MFRSAAILEQFSHSSKRGQLRFQNVFRPLRYFSFEKKRSLWEVAFSQQNYTTPVKHLTPKSVLPWNKHPPLFQLALSQYPTFTYRGFSTIINEGRLGAIPLGNINLANTETPVDTESIEFKERLKAAQEDADRFPDNAKLQADYLKFLNMVNPAEVTKRCEKGQYAMNEAARRELMRALLKTGLFDTFPIDAILNTKEGKIPQGSSPKNPLYIAQNTSWLNYAHFFAYFAFAAAILWLWFGKGGVGDGVLGKQSMLNPVERSNTTFEDVKGADEAKEELQDIVEFLKNPTKFTRLNAKLPKGILLVGPPGCGKTLVARALAGEAGVPFFFTSGSEFEEMFVGVGASRVRKLFEKAKAMAPCVVFIDEIDAIGGKRDSPDNRYHKMTLNQLLVELDGFEQTTGIIVVAATNIPETLDKAITRPGRFDRKVLVDAPDVKARKDMFDLYLKDRAASDVNIEDLAKSTQGFTGADISNMVNVAAIEATKRNLTKIPMSLIRSALDTVSMGPARKSLAMAPEIKKLTAYHEAGHALVGLYSPGGNEIIKATLVPRGHALGMVAWQPKDELLNTKQDFISQIDMCMGGRVAEELIFGSDKITPGAGSDLQHASKLARSMVLSLGMGERLGLQSFTDAKSVSPDTARVAEQEVQDILQSAYNRAKIILTEHQKEHHALANALLDHETLTLDEIKMVIAGKDLKSHFRNKNQEEQALRAKEDELYGALPSFPDALGASTKQPLAVETTPKDENKQQVLK